MRVPIARAEDTPPVAIPHFPSRLHAYVWRNWQLVPTDRLAQVVGAQAADMMRLGRAMGLPAPRPVSEDQWHRSLITIIRRNWHLLPYEQLLALVGWTEEQLAFALREDDFLFIKLGSLKPSCAPLSYRDPDEGTLRRMMEIAAIVRREFPDEGSMSEPLFSFVNRLSQPTPPTNVDGTALFRPRFCYSYFALYGDPLLAEEADLYPDGYLSQLAESGVDGVWLPAVLRTLAPFPWDAGLSARHEDRVRALQRLVEQVRWHGMGVYLYLNEPRALPLPFYDAHPALRGVAEDDHAALCTSVPDVQRYMTAAIPHRISRSSRRWDAPPTSPLTWQWRRLRDAALVNQHGAP